MKIKLAILHSDATYLSRLSSILGEKYRGKLAMYVFTDHEAALSALSAEKIDVFLADDFFEIDTSEIPQQCGFAYFVGSPEVDTFKGHPAVCQFQRTELLYKQILNVFSEAAGETSVRNIYSGNTKLVMFSSPCGGVGTSTLAAACAARFANRGRRVLYLNLERFGGADAYFSAEGAFDMSDVVYAVKSRRSNLAIKLESCVRRDGCGVYYFATAKVALDMMELSAEEQAELVSTLEKFGGYDCIVVDVDFSLDQETLMLLRRAHALVCVGDGLPVSGTKIQRAYGALKVLEQESPMPLTERICMIQNKFTGKFDSALSELGIRSVGVVAKLRHKADEQIVDQLALSDAFDAILEA